MPGELPPNHFRILYFASAASFTRKSSDNFPAPMPVTGLFGVLEKLYPGITKAVLDSCAVTVNLEYVDVEEEGSGEEAGVVINVGDEVAIIPPVSSG